MEENSIEILFDEIKCNLIFTDQSIQIISSEKSEILNHIHFKNIYGCKKEDDENKWIIRIYYLLFETEKKYSKKEIKLQFNEEKSLLAGIEKINSKIEQTIKRKHITVLVNPYTGNGRAVKTWNNYCKPIFDCSPVTYKEIITSNEEHAFQIGKTFDFKKSNAIVCVGGDGLLNETLNGVFDREDWRQVINETAFGILPGGSGNGLAASLDTLDPTLASFYVVKGNENKLDIFSVIIDDRYRKFGFLSFNFCLVGDVEYEQESYRWIKGYLRYYIAIIKTIAKFKSYSTKLAWLPDGDDKKLENDQLYGSFRESDEDCKFLPENEKMNKVKRMSHYGPSDHIGHDISNIPSNWNYFNSTKTHIFVTSSLSELDSETHACSAKPWDGLLHTIVGHGMTRMDSIQTFLKMSEEYHLHHPKIEYIKSKALILEAGDKSGHFSIDGEQIEYGNKVKLELYNRLITILGVKPGDAI
jgi:sphingosine kinase